VVGAVSVAGVAPVSVVGVAPVSGVAPLLSA